MLFDLIIPTNHPALPGHFPGQPIIPAALLLDEIRLNLENIIQQPLLSVNKVRFTAPVKPDTLISVECLATNQSDYRFLCRANGELVAKGIFSTCLSEHPRPVIPNSHSSSTLETSALYERLPHSGNMCLLDTVIDHDASVIHCMAANLTGSPLKRGHKISSWIALEYAAQAFALHGLLNTQNTVANPIIDKAFVATIKHMTCFENDLHDTDKPLQVSARILASQPQLASCEFLITLDNKPLAVGQFNVVYS